MHNGSKTDSKLFKGILLVGAIAAILSFIAWAIPKVTMIMESIGNQDQEKILIRVRATENFVSAISTAVKTYELQTGQLPNNLEDLTIETETRAALLRKSKLLDPWGTPYQYTKKTGFFEIRSAGPDARMDTPDDIYSR